MGQSSCLVPVTVLRLEIKHFYGNTINTAINYFMNFKITVTILKT